jgi:tripartite ATP-independent transporter DctM subunit
MILMILLLAFLILLVIGMPVGYAMGVASLVSLFMMPDATLDILPARMFAGVDSFSLMAIPFFILAGELMHNNGISTHLVRFASALVGHFRGGMAMVGVTTSMVFAGISGSATADTSAVGSIMIPSMVEKNYKRGFVATLIACAGTLGPIIPPSLLMIIYGSMTGISVGKLFMAGIIPGLIIGVALIAGSYFFAVKDGYEKEPKLTFKQGMQAFREASLALFLPIIVIGGILGGVITATEAGVIAVVYSILVSWLYYRTLTWANLYLSFLKAIRTTSTILIIVAMANVFSWIVGFEKLPMKISEFFTTFSDNKYIVMLLVMVFLLILGLFMETISALILLVPVLSPLAQVFHIDPIHFATVVVITLLIGAVHPPIGILLFITTKMANCRIRDTIPYLLPFIAIMIGVIILLIFVPSLVTAIPNLF